MTFKPVNNFSEANSGLDETSTEITTLSNALAELREKYLTAKAACENAYSRYLLEAKLKDPDMTQSEIKAQAVNLSYDDKLAAIKAERAYRSATNRLKSLYERMDALREMSYNLRRESKI